MLPKKMGGKGGRTALVPSLNPREEEKRKGGKRG